jgi:precorrin-3B synthase
MMSGDGFIVRVQPKAKGLSPSQLKSVSEIARTFGNGCIDVTRRANLQIRGLTSATLPKAQDKLADCGLAACDPDVERRSLLLVSPLSELDVESVVLYPLAEGIERMLSSAELPSGLSPKFCVVVDGGGHVTDAIGADIRIDLRPADPNVAYLSLGTGRGGDVGLGSCRASEVPVAVRSLIECAAREGLGTRRMRDLITANKTDALRRSVQHLLLTGDPVRSEGRSVSLLGHHRGPREWFGIGVPFGSCGADQWDALAGMASRFGSGHIRLTPARGVLLLDVTVVQSDELARAAQANGFIVDPGDPLLRVVACPGAPACEAGWDETRTFARLLIGAMGPLLTPTTTLHVSGCPKSCALTGPADITVVHDSLGSKVAFEGDVTTAAQHVPVGSDTLIRIFRHAAVTYVAEPEPRCERPLPDRFEMSRRAASAVRSAIKG